MRIRLVKVLTAGALWTATGVALASGADVYKDVFNAVDQGNLDKLMKDMTGSNPVTVDGATFTISDRYLPASKANWRKYFSSYMKSLGLNPVEMPYDQNDSDLEQQGHDIEAVLPGKSKDSVIIIVHYDSMGPHGADNPAVDDDMSGMAQLMETARLLVQYKDRLQYTVRFVAADYEEWGGLSGARFYANYIKDLAQKQGFKLVAGIDDEQSGWKEGDNSFDVYDCGGATDSPALGKLLMETASTYAQIGTTHGCMGENSDHYALWEIGLQSVVYSEHDPFSNDHFDHAGGDTYAKIDLGYHYAIAQVGVTFAARVVGIDASHLWLAEATR
jgi:hypothetical protein